MQREVKYTNSVPTVGDVMREGISKLQIRFLNMVCQGLVTCALLELGCSLYQIEFCA